MRGAMQQLRVRRRTVTGGARLLHEVEGGREEGRAVLRVHVRQLELQPLELGRQLQVLRVVVNRQHPEKHDKQLGPKAQAQRWLPRNRCALALQPSDQMTCWLLPGESKMPVDKLYFHTF